VVNANDNGTMDVLAQTAPVSLSVSPVPESSNALLLLSGLGLIGWKSRKEGDYKSVAWNWQWLGKV
jgi:hypothetical protein